MSFEDQQRFSNIESFPFWTPLNYVKCIYFEPSRGNNTGDCSADALRLLYWGI
jgi:hypothetical protein